MQLSLKRLRELGEVANHALWARGLRTGIIWGAVAACLGAYITSEAFILWRSNKLIAEGLAVCMGVAPQ